MKRGLLSEGILALVVWSLLLSGLAAPALAQDTTAVSGATPTLATLDVALWPEYDRPEVLVIYRGQFAADVTLPVAVEWRIPASAGGPSAVAALDPDEGLVNQPNTTRIEGDWLVTSFELSTPGFQVEYYAPYVASGDNRSFDFTYPGDYPVTVFTLEAQVPPTAQGFALDPPADSVIEDSDGLTYHQAEAGPLAEGESASWTLSYAKTDASLTAGTASPAPAAEVPPVTAATGEDNSTVWIFLIAFVSLVGVGAGAFWLGRRASGPVGSASEEGRQSYCHVCGSALPVDARHCPQCATPVRGRR
jgi:hypothetical protein